MSETERQLRMLASDGAVSIIPDKTEGTYLVEFFRWDPAEKRYRHRAGKGPTLEEAVKSLYDKWSARK